MASIHRQSALRGGFLDPLGHAVGGEHGDRAGRDVVQLVHEDGAAGAQVLDNVAVMDDLMADIDRRAVFLQCAFDDLDGPFHTGAEAAGLGEDDANHAETPK